MSVALVAVPHTHRPHLRIRRGGVRLGVLRDTEAAWGHRWDIQVRAARRSGIGSVVGESDCALLRTGYGLESRASDGRGEDGRDFAGTEWRPRGKGRAVT